MSSRRLDVRSAAEVLGISVDAVRMRVRRGSIPSEKDAEGHVWVWVDTDESPQNTDETETSQATSSSSRELVEDLREQVAYLKQIISTRDEELAAEREANREQRRLLAAALERIPELEAAGESAPEQEPHEGSEDRPQEPPEEPEGEGTRPGLGERLRRWWRG